MFERTGFLGQVRLASPSHRPAALPYRLGGMLEEFRAKIYELKSKIQRIGPQPSVQVLVPPPRPTPGGWYPPTPTTPYWSKAQPGGGIITLPPEFFPPETPEGMPTPFGFDAPPGYPPPPPPPPPVRPTVVTPRQETTSPVQYPFFPAETTSPPPPPPEPGEKICYNCGPTNGEYRMLTMVEAVGFRCGAPLRDETGALITDETKCGPLVATGGLPSVSSFPGLPFGGGMTTSAASLTGRRTYPVVNLGRSNRWVL